MKFNRFIITENGDLWIRTNKNTGEYECVTSVSARNMNTKMLMKRERITVSTDNFRVMLAEIIKEGDMVEVDGLPYYIRKYKADKEHPSWFDINEGKLMVDYKILDKDINSYALTLEEAIKQGVISAVYKKDFQGRWFMIWFLTK